MISARSDYRFPLRATNSVSELLRNVCGCRQSSQSESRRCSSPFTHRSLVDTFSVFVGALLARLGYKMRQVHYTNVVIALLPVPIPATKSLFSQGIMLHGALKVASFHKILQIFCEIQSEIFYNRGRREERALSVLSKKKK